MIAAQLPGIAENIYTIAANSLLCHQEESMIS
jgi:hypothetical protein